MLSSLRWNDRVGLGDIAGHPSVGACLDEQPENRQPGGLAKGREQGGCVFDFHFSKIVEHHQTSNPP